MTMQTAKMTVTMIKRVPERGKRSAMIIPVAAISAKPTNG
jgi:hypothetical protein